MNYCQQFHSTFCLTSILSCFFSASCGLASSLLVLFQVFETYVTLSFTRTGSSFVVQRVHCSSLDFFSSVLVLVCLFFQEGFFLSYFSCDCFVVSQYYCSRIFHRLSSSTNCVCTKNEVKYNIFFQFHLCSAVHGIQLV